MCKVHKAGALQFYKNGIVPLASCIHIRSMQKVEDLLIKLQLKEHNGEN
jgi:hypothetical protein